MNAIFGPNTPRVLKFLISLRKLTDGEIDQVTSAWNEGSPVDRALAWAHLQLATASKEECRCLPRSSASALVSARIRARLPQTDNTVPGDRAAGVTRPEPARIRPPHLLGHRSPGAAAEF